MFSPVLLILNLLNLSLKDSMMVEALPTGWTKTTPRHLEKCKSLLTGHNWWNLITRLTFRQPRVDFIKPFAPRPGAKCAGNNVFCFIKKNSTPCASPWAYLRHTPHAMRYAPWATRHAPNFYEGILVYCALRRLFLRHGLCAEKSFAICAAPKIELAPRPKFFAPCAMRRPPNFYEIDPYTRVLLWSVTPGQFFYIMVL